MKANGNMYEGVKTWNMIGGDCQHMCGYCSTHSLKRFPANAAKYSGPPTLYRSVLNKCPGYDKTVFVAGQNDLFASHIPSDWILTVLKRCQFWDNTYLFQTKNPERFLEFLKHFPEKTILCTTIETNRLYPQMGNTPLPVCRADAMSQIKNFRLSVTLEPLMAFDLDELVELIHWCNPEYVSIGADSKNHHLTEPSKDEVLALIADLERFTKVVPKSNLKRLLK